MLQCTKEWEQDTVTGILDVHTELKNLFIGDNVTIYSVIVSRVNRNQISGRIKKAGEMKVNVLTIDELMPLLNEIRKGNQPLIQLLKYLKGG